MFAYLYHVAFDATTIPRLVLLDEDHAVFEADFAGKHIGDFNGIPATGIDVRVPMCVVYDVVGGLIWQARISFELPALLKQLGIPSG